jgi:hypothetical protein
VRKMTDSAKNTWPALLPVLDHTPKRIPDNQTGGVDRDDRQGAAGLTPVKALKHRLCLLAKQNGPRYGSSSIFPGWV